MNEPNTANAINLDELEKLRKQLEALHRKKFFLPLSRLVFSIAIGTVFGTLAYADTSIIASAILIGLAVSVASIALNEAEHLRKHTDAILDLLDKQLAASYPEPRQ